MDRVQSDSAPRPRNGLVLSRNVGEVIHIGDDITITVDKVSSRVKLRIECPMDISIRRGEPLTGEAQS
jgi:carbon storage regulator CsrA